MNAVGALYGGLDLHGDNVFCSLLNQARQVVFERRLPNDPHIIEEALEPYRKGIRQLAVESTYNWYWLVDGLRRLHYDTRLANPSRMQENIGLKMADDKTDARFVARQLVNGILPEGYVYTGQDLGLKELSDCDIGTLLSGKPEALLMAQASFRHIAFLEREIKELEKAAMKVMPDKDGYQRLMTVPGIGPVLARTILLETGPIDRFRHAGNYASYCRTVRSEHTSNGRVKGKGNDKSGNKYLAWAYVEAAGFAARHSPEMRAWFQRKQARSGKRVIAVKALACKLAKACFFMMRDRQDFDVKRLVG